MDSTNDIENRFLSPGLNRKIRFFVIWSLFTILVIIQTACTQIKLTPVTQNPSGYYNQGQVVWHDLLTDDVETAKAFYGGLLGWRFKQSGRYTIVMNGSDPIGGMVELKDEVKDKC